MRSEAHAIRHAWGPSSNADADCVVHRRKRYDDFIQTVPLLQHLDAHERGLVADAFKEKDLEDGEAALTEGESVNNLYIVQEGTMQGGDDADAVHFGPGEFFGELALVLDEPIEMTVSSLGETSHACLVTSVRTSVYRG